MSPLDVHGTEGALPIALVGAVLVALAWGVGAIFGHGRRTAAWEALLTCLAVIGWITIGLTVVQGDLGTGTVNLHWGQEIRRALDSGASAPWTNLVGNIVLFVPFGAVVALLVRGGALRRIATATVLAAALSVSIEAVQLLLGRVADVDDVVLNTGGALLGALVAAAFAGPWSRSSGPRTAEPR